MSRCGKRAQSLPRDDAHEVALDLHRVLLLREAETLREPANVRVDDDALRRSALGRDDVRRLAPDAGQPHEVVQPLGHLPVELLEQHAHRALAGSWPSGGRCPWGGCRLELLERDGEVVLGPAVLPEQLLGDAVHRHVRRLGREHHRDEQLDRVAEAERDGRVRVGPREPLDDLADALALRPDPPASLEDVVTRRRECHPALGVFSARGSGSTSQGSVRAPHDLGVRSSRARARAPAMVVVAVRRA